MIEAKQFVQNIKETLNPTLKDKKEVQLLINQKNFLFKINKHDKMKFINLFLTLLIIFLIILSLIFYFIKVSNNSSKYNFHLRKINEIKNIIMKSNSYFYIINNDSIVYNNKSKDDPEFVKYQHMLPHLTPDFKTNSSIEEIFNARQLYISDVKITPEYIRYIRPINETEEEKYHKKYAENETIIDKNLFEKRADQYNYYNFCTLALYEKLIDEREIKYDNKPLMSIVIPSYNKQNIFLKSITSIQNQNFKNIEIIIVDDCSTDNSSDIYNYLLESDPRIRIFHHMTNMGCWRSRLDGILYSRGKYIILFDAGDLYEDNYVLLDAYNVIEKYNLDSCKFLFRVLRNFGYLKYSALHFHVGNDSKIVYKPENIKALNSKIFTYWGNIWTRLVRANILIKAIFSLNELTLNIHKNTWDDVWFNDLINMASYSFAVFDRVGYVYFQNGYGEGTPKSYTEQQKNKIVKEFVGFLYFDYNFSGNNKTAKALIVKKLKEYNETDYQIRLQNFKSHFDVLNNLLEALIKDSDISKRNRRYCEKLLEESRIREKSVNLNKTI